MLRVLDQVGKVPNFTSKKPDTKRDVKTVQWTTY